MGDYFAQSTPLELARYAAAHQHLGSTSTRSPAYGTGSPLWWALTAHREGANPPPNSPLTYT